jgi:phosphate acetyltransferase
MSAVLEKLYERAKKTQSTLVLSEAPDPRVIEAVRTAAALGLAKQLVLVGDKKTIEEKLGEYDSSVITIIDPKDSPLTAGYTQALFELRKDKGLTLEEAGKLIQKPLYFGVMMVRKRDADGMVTGAATSSPDVLRAALQVVRLKEGNTIVSNCQMLDMSNNPFLQQRLAWARCVVNIDPSAENLAEIAVQTAKSMKELLDIEPRVAMLSFSTKGSAKHPFIDKVTEATRLVKKIAPDILVDGELQFDAAIVKEVGKTKCPTAPWRVRPT